MKTIEIDIFFGDKPVHIEISAPMGAGNSFHVMINKYYNGELTKTANYGWQVQYIQLLFYKGMMYQL